MWFWIIPALAAAIVVVYLVAALRRGSNEALSARDSDIAVYKDQLAEIDRDLAKGTLTEAEAEAVRVEVSRRLLDADRRAQEAQNAETGPTRAALAVVATIVVAGSLGLYYLLGVPGAADLPLKERIAALDAARAERPSQILAEDQAAEFLPKPDSVDDQTRDLAMQLRSVMSENPNDIEGLGFLVRTEAQLGNYAAVRAAQERIVTLKADEATIEERLTLLETMVFAAGGYISPEAEAVINQIIEIDPGNLLSRYYQGLLELQSGRPDRTFPIWQRLLDVSPPNAPYLPVIRQDLPAVAAAAGVRYEPPAETRGPSQEDIQMSEDMTPEERAAMIEGMVSGLADRLATEGGPPQDWARLITALGVLGRQDEAKAIADEAAMVFEGNANALLLIAEARTRAGVPE